MIVVVVQNLFRWKEGPVHNSVKPVLIELHEVKDRNDLYAACKEGLKKTGLVITEDSRSQWILNGTLWNLRSRLGGKGAKEVSSKFNFNSFVDHYQAYPTAQALFNKMVRLI